MPLRNLAGQKIGLLTVLERSTNSKSKSIRWLCKCDCGNEKIILSYSITRGDTRSCGCLTKNSALWNAFDRAFEKQNRTRLSVLNPKEYASWSSMHGRCFSKADVKYHLYGGRGITVCDRWMEFEYFLEDMGPRPQGKTLDRINGSLGYSPENCRWASMDEQQENRSCTKWVTFPDGTKKTLKAFSKDENIPYARLKTHFNKCADIFTCVRNIKSGLRSGYRCKDWKIMMLPMPVCGRG